MKGERRGAQLIRTLQLLRLLDGLWCEVLFLAAHFDVTQRTIRRDLAFLRTHGFVIESRGLSSDGRGRGGRPCDRAFRLAAWPAKYDLTQGQATARTVDAVDLIAAAEGRKVRRA